MNNNTVVLTTLLNGEQAKKELDEMRVHAQTLSRTIDDLRKKGGKNAKYKLTDKEDQLIEMLCIEKRSKEYIAKKLKCSVSCLNAHIKRMKEM